MSEKINHSKPLLADCRLYRDTDIKCPIQQTTTRLHNLHHVTVSGLKQVFSSNCYFFLWRCFRSRFLRLCVDILCRLRFLPLGINPPYWLRKLRLVITGTCAVPKAFARAVPDSILGQFSRLFETNRWTFPCCPRSSLRCPS